MDQIFLFVNVVITFAEARIKGKIDYNELAEATGFSLPYVRELFTSQTNKSLYRYILERKIANAAFECSYTDKTLFTIGMEYGFNNADAFTRAFKRIVGVTPSEFRRMKVKMKRIKLCAGVYGIELPALNQNEIMKGVKNMKISEEDQAQGILLGVPRVQYGPECLTPFPACLRACANYIGIDISYDYVMAASGAAFRLTWDETQWNLGNVDSIFTYDDPERVYRQGIESLGCSYSLLDRESSTKEEFIKFNKSQIDKGNPVIALGIIGPPEACIITGYRNGGDTLLGWSFFQDNPEYNRDITFDEAGYYITQRWWDNPDTLAVMALEPTDAKKADIKTILTNAIDVMTGRKCGNYAKGLSAYDAWIKAVENDKDFSEDLILPILAERLFTHGDAIDCISDGRYNAALFMKKAAEEYPEHKALFEKAETYFINVYKVHTKLLEVIGGWERGETQMRNFANPDVRKRTVQFIREAKENDEKAFAVLKKLVDIL